MWVPGATRSGFIRRSSVGPRLEKSRMSRALLDAASLTQPSPPVARTFSEAPTVITFLAVPGDVMLS